MHDKFGDIETKVAVYGDIEISENIEAYLKLPSGFRVFNRIEDVQAKKRAELAAISEKWDIRDRLDRENGDGERMSPDELRKEKDEEFLERKACTKERIDLTKVRATELPSNKDIFTPGPASLKEEICIQQRMISYMETVSNYKWKYCDVKGNCKEGNNLTEQVQAGLDEIKDGVKNKGWMVYNSDKSGKIVLDTKENFIECMKEHFESDKIVTPEEVRAAEIKMNHYSKMWCKVMNIGEAAGSGQAWRCNRALVGNFVTIPSLQGLRKDHKGDLDGNPTKGPKLRP